MSNCPAGVRAPIVAWKRGNARGAKGCGKVESVMDMNEEGNQRKCPKGAKQAGEETRARPGAGNGLTKTPQRPFKLPTKPRVWTDRMLKALRRGVKGGKWFALIDKVFSPANLDLAFKRVLANGGSPGVDNQSVDRFGTRRGENIARLASELKSGGYEPKPVRRVWIEKPGSKDKRPLGIPAVCDRVVQASLLQTIEPIFEKEFAGHSYGFRPGRGCRDALRRVQHLINSGYTWVVDADLKAYFDTIGHDRLLERVRERIADGRVIDLIAMFLKQGVMDGMEMDYPEQGTPQGGVISPLLSNIYLNPLDHLMAGAGLEMVRYADDFVILCRDEASAARALELVRQWTGENNLTLHPEKTHVVDLRVEGAGFDFLGYHFRLDKRWPRTKSRQKIKRAIHAKTKRANGNSLPCIIADVNRGLKGWFEYFKHSHKPTFPRIDGYVRNRLRAILLKRSGRRGIPKGDHFKEWPNAYFAAEGLFSTQQAHTALVQSARRKTTNWKAGCGRPASPVWREGRR